MITKSADLFALDVSEPQVVHPDEATGEAWIHADKAEMRVMASFVRASIWSAMVTSGRNLRR